MRDLTLSVIALSLLLLGCNKYDNTVAATNIQVPAFTETGAGTFGAYVNGNAWANFGETFLVPDEGIGQNVPNKVAAGVGLDYTSPADSVFSVSGSLTVQSKGKTIREENMSISLSLHGNLKGVHLLNTRDYQFYYENLIILNNNFYSLQRNPVTVTIYKDTTIAATHQRIVSGKFYGTLYHTPNMYYPKPDSLQLTGGVFDVSFSYYK